MQSDAVVHVIDDDDAVRESLAFLLKSARIAVKTYESAAAFLGASPPVTTGCVITDVRMPEISGIELLQRLREGKVAVPVIVITGHGDVPLAVEAMKLGAVDFFEKPFDDEALLAAVRSALSQLADSSKRDAGQADINGKLATLSNRERLDLAQVGNARSWRAAGFSGTFWGCPASAAAWPPCSRSSTATTSAGTRCRR